VAGNFGEALPDVPESPKMSKMAIGETPPIRGIVFDLDGTLIHQALDFEAIRREIGLPQGSPLLEALEQLLPAERDRAWAILDRHEVTAASAAELLPGVPEFLAWLDGCGVRRAVLTRNSRAAAGTALARCRLAGFDPIVSRDDAPFKPQPDGLLNICVAWNLRPAEVLMIGDYVYDIQVGRRAGTRTALLTHGRVWPFAGEADLEFDDFADGMDNLRNLLG
jgi:HAD superfamily hydrolase (TIGR01549 family)